MDGSVILERLGRRKNILLLQGPMGPFFDRLARFLTRHGRCVTKVNFNGGDEWFYRQPGAVAFREGPDHWPGFFDGLLNAHDIDAVILFGDCRPYHRSAIYRARLREVAVFVFEEGYVRPNYVTFEFGGVNAFSMLPRFPVLFNLEGKQRPRIKPPARSFERMAWYAVQYYLMGRLRRDRYQNYRHHKPFDIFPEATYWIRANLRKHAYRIKERGVEARLAGALKKRFFLVPLQVYNDSQVRSHSDYRGVRAFILEIITSFARSAPADVHLVLKHHPMDRGHRDYARQIRRSAKHLGIADRVHYIHDQHLPTLLKAAIGTVVINSTVGISSLFHGTPVKLMGRAVYDIRGLVHEGDLASFWTHPVAPDHDLVTRMRHYLIDMTQVGGSFYCDEDIECLSPEMDPFAASERLKVLGPAGALPVRLGDETRKRPRPAPVHSPAPALDLDASVDQGWGPRPVGEIAGAARNVA